MQVNDCLILARKHLGNAIQEGSARFCMSDAVRSLDEDREEDACRWALKSLGYSVGVFHPDHATVAEFAKMNGYKV